MAFKICILRQKVDIIFATRAAANLIFLSIKISVLRQKLVICAIRAVAILGLLVFKIYFTSKISRLIVSSLPSGRPYLSLF